MKSTFHNPNKYTLGKSKIVPFREDEDSVERHEARLKDALNNFWKMKNLCQLFYWDIELSSTNRFITITSRHYTCTWHPYEAQLIVSDDWDHPVHSHDYMQTIKYIQRLEEYLGNEKS